MQKAVLRSTALLLTLLMLLLAADAREKKKQKPEDTVYGTVSCSIPQPPPLKGAPPNSADSIALCLGRHGTAVIIDDVTRLPLPIENPDTLEGYEGHRVSVSGFMNGQNFHVVSLRVL